jgi:hypothetical protein
MKQDQVKVQSIKLQKGEVCGSYRALHKTHGSRVIMLFTDVKQYYGVFWDWPRKSCAHFHSDMLLQLVYSILWYGVMN